MLSCPPHCQSFYSHHILPSLKSVERFLNLEIESSKKGHFDIYLRIENESNKDLRTIILIWWVKHHSPDSGWSCFIFYSPLSVPHSATYISSHLSLFHLQSKLSPLASPDIDLGLEIMRSSSLRRTHKGFHRFSHRKHSGCLRGAEEQKDACYLVVLDWRGLYWVAWWLYDVD